jgi:protein-S-isoprenylcysteine O-methyltransferase Ste14
LAREEISTNTPSNLPKTIMNRLIAILSLQSIWTTNAFAPLSLSFSQSIQNGGPSVALRKNGASTVMFLSDIGADPGSFSSFNNDTASDMLNNIQNKIQDVELPQGTEDIASSFKGGFSSIMDNLQDGEVGSRGEVYFAAQIILVLCILFGTVPLVGDFITFLFGPGLVLVGGTVATLGVQELGSNLTPWPSPPENGELVTNGRIFNESRHPIYAGLLCLMLGLSVWSGSSMRVLLCAALWYLLDTKSDIEEAELIEKFGSEYLVYKEKVTNKFIPQTLTAKIENFMKKD